MKAKSDKCCVDSVVDCKCPWRLPRLKYEIRPYPYRVTKTEWKTLLAQAAGGDADAGATVAGYYQYGCKDRSGTILVRRSKAKSAEWLRRSAELGSAIAQVGLGVLLSAPQATTANRREARTWFKKAFRQADSAAAYNLALMFREECDFRNAARWFKKGIALNDVSAHLQLGIHYYWGIGVRKNYKAAVRAFQRTARAKHIAEAERDDAFCYLAIAHLEGNGVRQSSTAAAKLLKRANIDNDHPAAWLLLDTISSQ